MNEYHINLVDKAVVGCERTPFLNCYPAAGKL